jgi:hypothetical protein
LGVYLRYKPPRHDFFLQASARADDLVLTCNGSTMELSIDHGSARWTSNDPIYGNLVGILNVSANSYEMLFERHFAAAATILWKFSLDRRTGLVPKRSARPSGLPPLPSLVKKLAPVKSIVRELIPMCAVSAAIRAQTDAAEARQNRRD